MTEPKDTLQPSITAGKYNARRVGLGDDVTLPCVAQGYPIPSYYWKRKLQGQRVPVALGERLTMLTAGLLKISKVKHVTTIRYFRIRWRELRLVPMG